MAWWLFKTEPDSYSIDDLARDGRACWDGIRNYQARNRLRDCVRSGDQVLVYHSSCKVPSVVGLGRVSGDAEPDPTQFDAGASGYDAKSQPHAPRWLQVPIEYVRHLDQPVSLSLIRQQPALAEMELVCRPRLSIQTVTTEQARCILELSQRAPSNRHHL